MITLKGKDPKMIANNLKPFRPTHPGEVLNGKRALNHELAMMMEAALGVDAAPLLAMQNEYNMLMAERDETFMEKLKKIRRIAAVF